MKKGLGIIGSLILFLGISCYADVTIKSAGGIQASDDIAFTGTTTNDSATAGNYGEYISSTSATHLMTGNAQYRTVCAIALTAGDWDISCMFTFTANGATVTDNSGGIGTADGNAATGLAPNVNFLNAIDATSTNISSMVIPAYRVSIAETTTYYLKAYAEYSAATPQVAGSLSARRVR